jgi:hypothetical protein
LEITDEGFKNIYYPKLTEAFVMGNGTTIKLPIDYSRVQNRSDGGVVYVLMMPLSVFNGYLALKADLIQKSNKRMLYSENYVVASLIKFEMVPPDAQLLNEYLPFFIIAAVVGFVILFILIGLLCKKFTNTDKRRDPNLLRSSNNNNNNNHSG